MTLPVRRSLIVLALLSALALPALAAPVQPGESAPDFRLYHLGSGSEASLGTWSGTPVVLWFPDLDGPVDQQAQTLQKLANELGVVVLVIPVVGPERSPADEFFARNPGVIVLHDAQGSVTHRYTGEFIAGVAPRLNFFVVGPSGRVVSVRSYPGLPPRKLQEILSSSR